MSESTREIRVLIADDEPLARRGVQQLLAVHSDCRVVGECRNGRETVRALRTHQPDLLFLDVQMPGLDGFGVLATASGEQLPLIVFVTAYDEFAVRAFDEHALDYVLKPVSQERFDRALERVRERLRTNELVEMSRRLSSYFTQAAASAPGGLQLPRAGARSAAIVAVPTATGQLLLNPDEIDWIEAEDYYAAVYALGQRHLVRESLRSLEKRLDARQFVRVHRSAIVRLDCVRELRSGRLNGSALVLRDGTCIPVSRRRREQVTGLLRQR